MCLHRSRPFIRSTLECALGPLRISHCCGYRLDELPQHCFVVWCFIVQQCIFFTAICILCGAALSHDRLGMPMEALLDTGRGLIQEGLCGGMEFSLLMLLLNVLLPKVRVMLFLRLLRCRCLSHRHHGDNRKNEDTACSRERIEAPVPPLQPRHTCDRLELPFSCDAILSGYEGLVSSESDQFTMW